MTVTAPPRPPRPSDPVDRQEVEALVEALFEEARQRARRRRRVRLAVVACVVLVGATVLAVFERTAESQSSSPAPTARSGVAGGKVKIVIAGTHYAPRVRMEASTAMAPSKPVGPSRTQEQPSAYRTLSADGTLITFALSLRAGRARSRTWSRST